MTSRPSLRVAQPGDQTSVEMAEAIEKVMRECIAAMPSAVTVSWEVPGTGTSEITSRSVPDSLALRRGMVYTIYEQLFPEDE